MRIHLQIGNLEAANLLLKEIEKRADEIVLEKYNASSLDAFVETGEEFTEEAVDLISLVYCDRYAFCLASILIYI